MKITPAVRFRRQRDSILPSLAKIEKRHGAKLTRSAMMKHMKTTRERENAQRRIKELEKKLEQLKHG